jgi:hypothetical protein
MEGPKTKADMVATPAVRTRLRRWAKCTLWVAGTSLILLDCGVHALLKPVAFDAHTARFGQELGTVATPAPAAVSSTAGGADDLYLPPGLRSGSFE